MKPKYIDIHTHLNFAAFDSDRDEVLARAKEKQCWMINVGTQADTSKKAISLANVAGDGFFATVGLHPIHTSKSYHDKNELGEGGAEFTSRGEVFDYGRYKELASDSKVVAIGECGLDYFRLEAETKEKQKKIFEDHIRLANETKKPLMCHIRNAYDDAYEILKSNAKVPANLHFFAGSWYDAKRFLDLGCTLSFTGVITFARNYDEVIQKAPLDMIMTETDSPYVTPAPYRGKRNEPIYVEEVFKAISSIRNEDFETVRQALVDNALRVFGLLSTK